MKSCPTCHRKFIDSETQCPLDDARLVAASGQLPEGVGNSLGQYVLVCQLGSGGMGNIYIARHQNLARYVAIKLLRTELAQRTDNVARFFHEAHTIDRLKHPNIVESIDLVEDAVSGAYCVLELLKGHDLRTRLEGGPLSIESAIFIATQLADALGKVHAIGVVHRDLKPENLILIQRDGRDDFVKLIDFGVAQIGQEGEGGIIGTAKYMAPEQGDPRQLVDRRADIYSLGVILFEMVTGQHPFPSGSDSEYLMKHADTKPPRPSRLAPRCPPQLDQLILRCLEKEPERRYASADQVAATLRMIDPRKRSGSRAGVIAAALLFVGGAGAAAFVLVPKYLGASRASAAAEPEPEPAAPVEAPKVAEGSAQPAQAAPAEVEEAPAPSEPQPAIVEIGIVSTPKGASVYREGETVALGVTPFTVPLSRSDEPVKMRFEKAGYQPKTVEVPLEASLEIEVSLAKQREPVATKSSVRIKKTVKKTPAGTETTEKKSGPVHREGTIDPFANK